MSIAQDVVAGSVPSELVLVTGAGRSGTSTLAGILARLGFRIPQPVLKENESNPRGFYEPAWSVRFHNKLLKRAGVNTVDSRPSAAELMTASLDEATETRLQEWLTRELALSRRVAVKDPRAAWVPGLWHEVAEGLGTQIGFVTMLRHPTEVIGSRRTYYASDQLSTRSARTFAVRHLCGWLNQNLTLERLDRGYRRAYVTYPDLLEDWRPVLGKVWRDLHMARTDWSLGNQTDVDDFVEPALRRHLMSWEDVDSPPALTELAEQAWTALVALARGSSHDAAAQLQLDEVGRRYAELYDDALAVTADAARTAATQAFRKGRREGAWKASRQLHTQTFPARARRVAAGGIRRLRRRTSGS